MLEYFDFSLYGGYLNKILIIDDNKKLCKTLARNLEVSGFECHSAHNGASGLEKCLQFEINIIILDVMLGSEKGIDVLKKLLIINKQAKIIMLTAYGTVNNSVEALKLGAFDYLEKPIDFVKLITVCNSAIERLELKSKDSNSHIQNETDIIITQNSKMIQVLKSAELLGISDIPVLISGESGTGKELIVDYIHEKSSYRGRQIEKINCAAFPESLLDNELFGHESGAYTGANHRYSGVFERAHETTLFLDEIGDMPLSIQAKILRTIQNKEVRRIGGSKNINVSVRFIAASNKDLEKLVAEGKFREDLYYRLSVSIFTDPYAQGKKR